MPSNSPDAAAACRCRQLLRDALFGITVADTGVGIEPAMLDRIFEMFTQLQAHRDRTQGGLGIGLTLARRLIELHDGTIAAFSDGPGRGSRFVVRLPLAGQRADGALGTTPAESASPPCRVLVAEDQADAAEMMRVMLELHGHDVRVATGRCEAAVDVAQLFEPHIAFVDIGMPRAGRPYTWPIASDVSSASRSCSWRSPAGARTRTSAVRGRRGSITT